MQAKYFSFFFVIVVCCLGVNAVWYRQYVEEPEFRIRTSPREKRLTYGGPPLSSVQENLPKKLYSEIPNEKVPLKSAENVNKNVNVNFVRRKPSSVPPTIHPLEDDQFGISESPRKKQLAYGLPPLSTVQKNLPKKLYSEIPNKKVPLRPAKNTNQNANFNFGRGRKPSPAPTTHPLKDNQFGISESPREKQLSYRGPPLSLMQKNLPKLYSKIPYKKVSLRPAKNTNQNANFNFGKGRKPSPAPTTHPLKDNQFGISESPRERQLSYRDPPLSLMQKNLPKLYSEIPYKKFSLRPVKNTIQNANFGRQRKPSPTPTTYRLKDDQWNGKRLKGKKGYRDPFSELLKDVQTYMKDSKNTAEEKCKSSSKNKILKKNATSPAKSAPLSLLNMFNIGSPKIRKKSSVHDGTEITLCWIETLTIREDLSFDPPKRLVLREYSVTFENSATIAMKDVECSRLRGEISPGNEELICKTNFKKVIVDDVKRSVPKNNTRFNRDGKIINFQQKIMKCVSGGIVLKNVFEWPDGTDDPKRRVEIRVAPKIRDVNPESCKQWKSPVAWPKKNTSSLACPTCVSSTPKSFFKLNKIPKVTKQPITTDVPKKSPIKLADDNSLESYEESSSSSSSDETCEYCDKSNETDVSTILLKSKPLPSTNLQVYIPTKPELIKTTTAKPLIKASTPPPKILITTTPSSKLFISIEPTKPMTTRAPPPSKTTVKTVTSTRTETFPIKNVTPPVKIPPRNVETNVAGPPVKGKPTPISNVLFKSTSPVGASSKISIGPLLNSISMIPTTTPKQNKTCDGSKNCNKSNSESCEIKCSGENSDSSISCGNCSSEENAGIVQSMESTTRKSTSLEVQVPTNKQKERRRYVLKMKVLLEEIDENEEKKKLLFLEKHLLLDARPVKKENISLLWHLKALNNSVNIETLKKIIEDTKLRNLTEIFSRLTEFPQQRAEGQNNNGTSFLERTLNILRNKNKTRKRRETVQVDNTKKTLQFLAKGLDDALDTVNSLKRDKRSAGPDKLVSIRALQHPVNGEEIKRWSDEKFFNTADGGRVRSLLEFKFMRNPTEKLRISSGS